MWQMWQLKVCHLALVSMPFKIISMPFSIRKYAIYTRK